MRGRVGMGVVLAVAVSGWSTVARSEPARVGAPAGPAGVTASAQWAGASASAQWAGVTASAQPAGAAPSAQPAGATAQSKDVTIDHVTPRRDFVGPEPARFAWTPVEGADSYSIGVWNEVDVLMWRLNNIPQASIERPPQVHFEAGTYFWSIVALRNGEQIADSGLAAFVVKDQER